MAPGPDGGVWYTAQGSGQLGRLDRRTARVEVFSAPGGPGPNGITVNPSGEVWYASLAGNHVARVDAGSGRPTVVQPPTSGQGAGPVWSDSRDRLWPSGFGANALVVFEPDGEAFRSFPLPSSPSNVRQNLGRPGEVWAAESAADSLVVVRGA